MHKFYIETSFPLELLSALFRIQNNGKLAGDYYNKTDKLQQVIEKLKVNINKSFEDDLDFFFNFESFFGLCLVSPVVHNNVYQSWEIFYEFLQKLDAQELFKYFLFTGYPPNDDVDVQNVEEVSNFIQNMNIPEKEKWKLSYIYMNPMKVKERFLKLLNEGYQLLYCTYQEEIESILIEKKKTTELSILEIKQYFADKEKLLKSNQPIDFYLIPSFFYDQGSLVSETLNQSMYVLIYGVNFSFTQKNNLNNQLVADLFKSLSDIKRVKIVQLLKRGPRYGYEIAQYLSLSNSTVAHHLSALQSLGIIYSIRNENKVYYYLNREKTSQLLNEVQHFLL